jgi:glycosyltransferase involved in cell wall biosynthesis
LVNMAKNTGLSGKISFTGGIAKPADIYKAMDIFVLPSLSENAPHCLLEAMATGLPVVATDVGDISHILDKGMAGVIVRPRDASALAGGIEGLLKNSDMAQKKGRFARKIVEERFSLSKMISEYEQICRHALREKGKA